MLELSCYNIGIKYRATYRVEKNTEKYIFVFKTYSTIDATIISTANREYEIAVKKSKIHKGFAKPLDYKALELPKLEKTVIELLYDYKGKNISEALESADMYRIIEVMANLLEPMTAIEENHLFYLFCMLYMFRSFQICFIAT